MAPTTRSSKKKKSPSSKQKNQIKQNTREPIQEVLIGVYDDYDISSDDSLSTDSEMEDLVQQTALKMTSHVHVHHVHAENAHKAKPTNSKSDTIELEVRENVGQGPTCSGRGETEIVLPFVLDTNPNSKSDIQIEVDHVTGTTSKYPTPNDDAEEIADAVSSELVQTGPEEEELFISLESISDSQSKEQLRQNGEETLHLQTAQRPGKGKKRARMKLATELDAGLDLGDTYFTFAAKQPTKKKISAEMVLMKSSQDKLLKKSIITPDFEKQHSVPPYREATRLLNRRKKKERESSTSQDWYNMAAAEMTSKLRNDIKALRMRSSLDPKRFYKHNDMTALPKFVQVGTIVESPADFYHSRIPKKQRKQTIVEELLADAETRRYNKRKYLELQERSKRWGQRKQRSKTGRKKGRK